MASLVRRYVSIYYIFDIISPGIFCRPQSLKEPRRILQLLFIFRPNLSDWLMALEVLLYNLLVLCSSLRCMLHKHKSSIQNKNHSINGVGGQFLGNITYESLHGACCYCDEYVFSRFLKVTSR